MTGGGEASSSCAEDFADGYYAGSVTGAPSKSHRCRFIRDRRCRPHRRTWMFNTPPPSPPDLAVTNYPTVMLGAAYIASVMASALPAYGSAAALSVFAAMFAWVAAVSLVSLVFPVGHAPGQAVQAAGARAGGGGGASTGADGGGGGGAGGRYYLGGPRRVRVPGHKTRLRHGRRRGNREYCLKHARREVAECAQRLKKVYRLSSIRGCNRRVSTTMRCFFNLIRCSMTIVIPPPYMIVF